MSSPRPAPARESRWHILYPVFPLLAVVSLVSALGSSESAVLARIDPVVLALSVFGAYALWFGVTWLVARRRNRGRRWVAAGFIVALMLLAASAVFALLR